jgi:hypothetical protein
MRQAKTLTMGTMLGALLVWGAPAVLAQAAPSGQSSETQTPAAKAPAKKSSKSGTPQPAKKAAGAAQQPAKGAGTSAQTQAGKGPAKANAQPAQKAASAQPAKKGAGTSQATKKQAGPATAGTAKSKTKKKAAPKPKKTSGKAGAVKQAPKQEPKVARRDPFESLIGRDRGGDSGPKLPGKAGLVISSLRLDGVVRYVDGMIAVVTNAQSRTYFLREGDQLYDGQVAKITMDGVTFHEVGKDAFGKPVEREVNKRMYPSPGELQ